MMEKIYPTMCIEKAAIIPIVISIFDNDYISSDTLDISLKDIGAMKNTMVHIANLFCHQMSLDHPKRMSLNFISYSFRSLVSCQEYLENLGF